MLAKSTLLMLFLVLASVGNAQPIRLHPENPHYFQYKGKPVILITSGEHYGAVINLDFDYDVYLETLASDNLNYTRIFTGTYVERQGAFGIQKNTLAPDPSRFVSPWARLEGNSYKFDLSKWNPEYFSRIKEFLGKASEKGIIVEISLFCAYYNDELWQASPFYSKNNINGISESGKDDANTLVNGNLLAFQEKFVRKMVTELNSFDNFFFEIQNEPWANMPETAELINPNLADLKDEWRNKIDVARPASLAWQKRVAEWIVDEERDLPKKHLIAQNFANFFYSIPEVSDAVSILNYHYAWPEAVRFNYGYDKVIGFDESGFSGSLDETYRRQAWRFILSGGGLFNNLDYSFTTTSEDGTGNNQAPGGGSPDFRKKIKHLQNFMKGIDFVNMKPDNTFIKLSPGTRTYALRSDKWYAAYFDASPKNPMILNLPPGKYTIEWIRPENGKELMNEQFEHTGGIRPISAPSVEGDLALRAFRSDL